MAAPGRKRGPAKHATAWGMLASIALHLGSYALIQSVVTLPTVDIEIEIPTEIELGFADSQPLPPPGGPAAAVAPPPPAAPATDPGETTPTTPPEPPARLDAAVPDGTEAAPQDAGQPPPLDSTDQPLDSTDQPLRDAGVGASPDAGEPLLAAFAPEGAQLALRLDLARLRVSALAPEVKALLAVIPDWQLVLDGSGLDPLEDLERLFIASPDLSRRKMVVAGQYARPGLAQSAVARLASARGVDAPWRTQGGHPVAPWANADETRRVVTLLGEQQFAITRPEDLGRVLAIAAALQARTADAGTAAQGDALLALGPDELVVFTAEGARAYVRAGQRQMVPTQLRIGVRIAADEEPAVRLTIDATYDDADEAGKARRFWDSLRAQFASHPLAALAGLSSPLSHAKIAVMAEQLTSTVDLTTDQARKVLALAASLLAPPPPPPALPVPRPGNPPSPIRSGR